MDCFTVVGVFAVVYISVYCFTLAVSDCDLGLLWASHFGTTLDFFNGKVIWITGASSGIGEFLAVELAKHGAKLALSARTVSNLGRVKQNCIDAGCPPSDVLILPMDVTDLSKHQELFDEVLKHFGVLDILVNNAGRSQRALWENIEIDVDKEIFTLNVFSVLSLSRIVVKYFEEKGRGQIVVTSSLAGVFGAPFSASYTATKHAIHGYFKTLRSEKLGKNLGITLLCPGPVFSNLLPDCFTDKKGKVFGEEMKPTDKRMTTDRCAYLSAVAIANELDEVWMGLFPALPLVYIIVYCPFIAKKIAHFMGTKKLLQIRDSRETVKVKSS